MKTWLSLLIIILSSVVFPVAAESILFVSPQFVSPQLLSIDSKNSFTNKLDATVKENPESVLAQKKSEHKAEFLLDAQQDPASIFAPQFYRQTASLFQARVQTDPEYLLKINFSPQAQLLRLFNLSFHQLKIVPWFFQISSGNNNRLSNWKDGNSLYTAKIIYC